MGVRILHDPDEGAVLYDSTTEATFGYLAHGCEGCGLDAPQILKSFLAYCDTAGVRDVRELPRADFDELWKDFHKDEHDHDAARVL